ncbi:hypothetical protein ACJRO7_033656 [Eucalyptus globulus]|uniref:Uncharacterized protein n=1 Tax=Eucalyptus globulus TaxID=34317 RepID=A0ABD3JNR6_EUCGL
MLLPPLASFSSLDGATFRLNGRWRSCVCFGRAADRRRRDAPVWGATEREEWGYDRGSALSVAAKAGLSEDVRAGDGFEGVLELRRTCDYG